MHLTHYPNCSADYPEKPEWEAAQELQIIELNKRETALICVDCGASIVVKTSSLTTK